MRTRKRKAAPKVECGVYMTRGGFEGVTVLEDGTRDVVFGDPKAQRAFEEWDRA